MLRCPKDSKSLGKSLNCEKLCMDYAKAKKKFWQYVVEKMEACNMPQSTLDPCLFVGDKVVCICYVDDLIFWGKISMH